MSRTSSDPVIRLWWKFTQAETCMERLLVAHQIEAAMLSGAAANVRGAERVGRPPDGG